MKPFLNIYFTSPGTFWSVNLSVVLFFVLTLGWIFSFSSGEILAQVVAGVVIGVAIIWALGGYRQMKNNYSRTVSEDFSH